MDIDPDPDSICQARSGWREVRHFKQVVVRNILSSLSSLVHSSSSCFTPTTAGRLPSLFKVANVSAAAHSNQIPNHNLTRSTGTVPVMSISWPAQRLNSRDDLSADCTGTKQQPIRL